MKRQNFEPSEGTTLQPAVLYTASGENVMMKSGRGLRGDEVELVVSAEHEPLTAKDRDHARFMALDGVPTSEMAKVMTAQLTGRLYRELDNRKRGKPSSAYLAAVGAILSDHLRNADPDAGRWGYRSHGSTAFSKEPVGYRPFKSAFAAMVSEGLLSVVPGHKQHTDWGGKKVPSWGRATRSRATPELLDLAAASGITPANHGAHFKLVERPVPKVIRDPLELRKGSVRVKATKYKGIALPLDLSSPAVAVLHQRMVRLNSYFAEQEIGGLPHQTFRRIFNDGGADDYAWNKGGRLSSVGANSYQNAKKTRRKDMAINGEAVVELDITASHLTILHALAGIEFDPSIDPYSVEGLPREVVKTWVTMTLGHYRFHPKWPSKAGKRLEETLGRWPGEVYPITSVQDRVISAIPLLASWPTSPWGWADLQYVESCAVLQAVETLAYDHDVPCLPVHDSIIIPVSKKLVGRDVLKSAFRQVTGVLPHLKVAQSA